MNDVSPGKLAMLIGAGVTFIFSWLPWISASGFGGRFSRNAWQSGTFPMATWAPLFAILVGFIAAVEAFKFMELPEKIWEFTVGQIALIASVFALLITISYLITDKGGASVGIGLILCFLGTIAMVAGYFIDRAGIGVNPNARNPEIPFEQPGFPPVGQTGAAPGQAPSTGGAPGQAPSTGGYPAPPAGGPGTPPGGHDAPPPQPPSEGAF